MKRTKINEKESGIGPYLKKNQWQLYPLIEAKLRWSESTNTAKLVLPKTPVIKTTVMITLPGCDYTSYYDTT